MSARAADETLPWSRLEWSDLDEGARARALTRPVQMVAAATREAVAAVLADVRGRGDQALRELTLRFDRVELDAFEVAPADFAAAEAAVAALGDDPNFAATITATLALKAPLANPALTGVPTAPTAGRLPERLFKISAV